MSVLEQANEHKRNQKCDNAHKEFKFAKFFVEQITNLYKYAFLFILFGYPVRGLLINKHLS